jgi:hypothetical protein
VANIYKYYVAYKLIEEQGVEREKGPTGLPQSVSRPQ